MEEYRLAIAFVVSVPKMDIKASRSSEGICGS